MSHPYPLRRGLVRRQFLQQLAAAGATAIPGAGAVAAAAGHIAGGLSRHPRHVALTLAETAIELDGEAARATLADGSLPGPVLRFREGDTVEIAVRNELAHDSSIHWHGILLPSGMDGVPGLSFAGIKPGKRFVYRFPLRQSGTYWYHSHSGFQEQTGLYGALIIEPQADERTWDREHVIVLSDWTFEDPDRVFARLKQQSHYYNRQRPTLAGLFGREDVGAAIRTQAMWARMRMDPSDLADVTGVTYRYLINGHTAAMNWRASYQPGERVLLRVINASAMSLFDFSVPGLALTVIAADGQPVQPVETDELRIGTAETYDVLIEPRDDGPYALYAEAMDRSGFTVATLAPAAGTTATPPPPRPKAMRGSKAMSMVGHEHHAVAESTEASSSHRGHHEHHERRSRGETKRWTHGPDDHGPGAAMINQYPVSRLHEPGIGLENAPHRVLTYADLRAPRPWPDDRPPAREVELHLTGNMERYMWSFDGIAFKAVEGAIEFARNERLRLVLVNDTMMDHPIHLHGMWMELENGAGDLRPRKHTIIVKPNERLSALVTPDTEGLWAFHCHLLYHMAAGMFRAVRVA